MANPRVNGKNLSIGEGQSSPNTGAIDWFGSGPTPPRGPARTPNRLKGTSYR